MGGRPSPPQVDYAGFARQQEQERQRLQGIEDEKYRVKGITDYIDYMSDNPKSMSFQAATGRYFKGVSPGATPGKALENYQTDKSINVDMVKQDPSKYFDRKTSQASIQPGRIRFGKLPDKSAQVGLLGSGEQDKKTLLGA